MDSLFKSSVPGASSGASATTPAICPAAPDADSGSDALWGGGHQWRMVAPSRSSPSRTG
jgi:hypothetical protein